MDARALDAESLAEISKAMDRSWCAALIEALVDSGLSFDLRRPLERTLADLDDLRFVGPLLTILEDRSIMPEVRDSAINVLSECGVMPSWSSEATTQPDMASSWIRSENSDLQRLGFSLGNRADRQAIDEFISEVFDPPEPGEATRITSMRACLPAAVASMAFGFEEPEYQARKVSLLDHIDPEVRAAAARTLLWDEPNFAEYPLIAATRDADPDVVIDALDVLRYYPTLAVRRTLANATKGAATLQQRQMADQSLASLDEDMRRELSALEDHPNQLRATRAWIAEARRVLAQDQPSGILSVNTTVSAASSPEALVRNTAAALTQTTQTEQTDRTGQTEQTGQPRSEQTEQTKQLNLAGEWDPAMFDSFNAPDGLWAPKLHWLEQLHVENIPTNEKAAFCEFLARHQDPNVRYRGTRILADCDRGDLLLVLLQDRVGGVRKSASFALHDVSPSQQVANAVLAPVLSGEIGGTQASESVRTWARHAFALNPEAAGEQVLALAEDRRESVRHSAINQIVAFGAPGGQTLVKFLRADPLVTWAVHSTLITSRHLLGISDRAALSALDQFLDVDNLWIQLALATFRIKS
jgi:hypothetical protein